MGANERTVNAYFVIVNNLYMKSLNSCKSSINAYFITYIRLYMKSGSNRSVYIAVAKSLKIVSFSN